MSEGSMTEWVYAIKLARTREDLDDLVAQMLMRLGYKAASDAYREAGERLKPYEAVDVEERIAPLIKSGLDDLETSDVKKPYYIKLSRNNYNRLLKELGLKKDAVVTEFYGADIIVEDT